MKTVIIVTLCMIAYLLIGFGVLVMRARTHYVDVEDTVIAMLFWPVICLTYVFYYATDGIKNAAQMLGGKLARWMKK